MSWFSPDQATAASHMLLVAALVALVLEAVRLRHDPYAAQLAGEAPSVMWSAICAASALIVERSYYIAARLVRGSRLDLWAMHPAPELLSTAVAASLLAVVVSVKIATRPTRQATYSVIAGLVLLSSFTAMVVLQLV